MCHRMALGMAWLGILLVGVAAAASADVSVSIGGEWGRGGRYEAPARPYYDGHPYHHHHWPGYRPEIVVVPEPVEAPTPVYYEPMATTPAAPPIDYSQHDTTAISQRLYDTRQLLDQKLNEGVITQAQHDQEATVLSAIDQQAHRDSYANGGYITGDEQIALLSQIEQINQALNNNLVAN